MIWNFTLFLNYMYSNHAQVKNQGQSLGKVNAIYQGQIYHTVRMRN